jgi:hypothetical protein
LRPPQLTNKNKFAFSLDLFKGREQHVKFKGGNEENCKEKEEELQVIQ